MNELLAKRYKVESAFMPKPLEIRHDLGSNRILTSGGNEYLIVGETETSYLVCNPHICLKTSIKKTSVTNTYPRTDDYILKDNYCYGVAWRSRNGFAIFDLSRSLENCR